MSPRPDVSDARKKQIIDAAINVFNRAGFKDARMEDIVKEAGISKGLVYWYYKSKEELIIAITDHLFGEEFNRMEQADDPSIPPRECLTRYFDLYVIDLAGMLAFSPIIYELYALAFRNATVKKVMRGYLERFIRSVEPIIQRGIDAGEFNTVNARQASIAFGSQIEGTLLLWAYAPDSMVVEKQLQEGISMLIKSLIQEETEDAK
ncbi:MAG: TetR/AcrR family transcriptional regulator [Leptolinea sp.]|nr:TetR/AcrR family transcriptional regulator [Leptolinea sp.]